MRHTLESMPRVDIDLLCLGNLLQKFLNDYPVVVTNLTGGDKVIQKLQYIILMPTHLGVISRWKLLWTTFTSSFRLDGVKKTRWSILSY